jgi:hypothetical protein
MTMPFLSLVLMLTFVAPDTGNPMQTYLPLGAGGWAISEPSRLYTGREIFSYMDGAGEVYLAYEFSRLLVQRYTRPNQQEILVELFDMGAARNAFGISTYMRGRGRSVKIGQDGEYKSGLLSFWRGRYYVCVGVAKENAATTAAILRLGREISEAIGIDGERPPLLKCLPAGKYRLRSLRYFYRDEILSAHITLPEGNPLQLGDSTEGVLVRMTNDRSALLVIAYSDSGAADAARTKFATQSMAANAPGGIAQSKGGRWSACTSHGRFVILVFDAPTRSRVREILVPVIRRLS